MTNESQDNIDTLVRIDKLRLLFELSFPAMFISFIMALLLTAILWPVQSHLILGIWLSLLTFGTLLRFLLFISYKRRRPEGDVLLVWKRYYFVTLLFSTLIWGIGSIVILPVDSLIHQVIVLCFMVGLAGGAISLYSTNKGMALVTICIIIVPILFWFMFHDEALFRQVSISITLFLFFILVTTKNIASSFHQNFLLTRKLSESEQQLRLAAAVFDHSQDGIFITDADGIIVDANPASTKITGYELEELIGKNPNSISSGRHSKEFYKQMWDELIQSGNWQGEFWNRRKSGEIYPQRSSIDRIVDEEGNLNHYVAVFHDISYIKRHEDELRQMAFYDPLTGLPNRLLLYDRIKSAINQFKRHHQLLALCYMDLDGFKPINDTHGHNVGDQILKEIGQRLQNAVRSSDTLARVGGDEFVALINDYEDEEQLHAILHRILATVSEPCYGTFGEAKVSVSIGVVCSFEQGDEDQLLSKADKAMYQAKAKGRNQYVFYQDDFNRL